MDYQEQGPQIVPLTSEGELNEILEKQKVETRWWREVDPVDTIKEIEDRVQAGTAVRLPDSGLGYQISPGVRPEFRVLEVNTKKLLEDVAKKWVEVLRQRRINSESAFLRITSLARTTEFQKQLIQQGYPAAENSTHTKIRRL
jgi:hypothetical protein